MVSALNAALSGLNAASKRIETSANNIANQFSTKTVTNGQTSDTPYAPQQVDSVSLSDGGVQALTRASTPATTTLADASSATGTSTLPNVDPQAELLNQTTAAYDFKANLKTIQVLDKTQQSLLNIVS